MKGVGHHVCENKLGLDDRSLGHVNLMAGFMTWVPKQNKISHVRTVCLLSPGCFIGASQAFFIASKLIASLLPPKA
jgi:hypothetical protein